MKTSTREKSYYDPARTRRGDIIWMCTILRCKWPRTVRNFSSTLAKRVSKPGLQRILKMLADDQAIDRRKFEEMKGGEANRCQGGDPRGI
jgi:hypothetical protein